MARHPHDFKHDGCPENYRAAHDLVRQRRWFLDTEAGTITSARYGRPLRRRDSSGYVYLNLPRTSPRAGHCVFAHRILWEAVHGLVPDGYEIDHANRVVDDNRRHNLRLLSIHDNSAQGSAHRGVSESIKEHIKVLLAQGYREGAAAAAAGVTPKVIRYWRHRWRDPAWLGWGRGRDITRRRHDQHFAEATL